MEFVFINYFVLSLIVLDTPSFPFSLFPLSFSLFPLPPFFKKNAFLQYKSEEPTPIEHIGPYVLVSRSIGTEIGGAIGVLFYLATTCAASMYALGAVETFKAVSFA